MSEEKVAVVVLNYNGKRFLEQFLPGIISYSAPHEVIVADNASTDGSLAFMREKFPQTRVISNDFNYGFAEGYNKALARVDASYFVLLNNDVEVTPAWLEPLLALMRANPSIAACQPKLLDWKHRHRFEYAGASGGFIDRLGYPFCRGRVFNHLEEDKGQYDDAKEIFWATGACMMVRASCFREAGGLDGSFFAHMEEIDLCWRMKNFGHKIYVQPASVVYHVGGGTLAKVSPRKTYLNFRNNLTMLARNDRPGGLVSKILVRLVLDAAAGIKFLVEFQPAHLFAVIRAHFAFYARIPAIRRHRRNILKRPGYRHDFSQVYKGSIVKEHFLEGRKEFSGLDDGFFTG